ncbi:MAG: hypothetical protein QT11_C0001G0609 [archaeon GW2011_AR20]|nr:MAG: hypothetical protein QT11_C0001G0609 [archaeon GW2011_AR20]MBS3160880.1 hypothetical protein [Candidatus Woesearchaeota archaeon]
MSQNRNKLIELFIGNSSNVVIHKVLGKATDNLDTHSRYEKEVQNSLKKALKYRNIINPINEKLNEKDVNYIKNKIIRNVKSELTSRIIKGYKNVNLTLIETFVEEFLKQSKII